MSGYRLRHTALGILLLAALSGCSTYEFQPNQPIEKLVADLEKSEKGILMSALWIPLITLDMQFFTYVDETEEYLAGHSHFDIDAWGPLFFSGAANERWYDHNNELYEIQEYFDVLLSIWATEKSVSRVPTGWREEIRREILFGLYRMWTEVRYLDELPAEYRTGSVTQEDKAPSS